MPQERNLLLQMSIRAMACAWTADEIEDILAAAERSQLHELPSDLCARWVRYLDCLSLQHFGKTFGVLLAALPARTDAPVGPA